MTTTTVPTPTPGRVLRLGVLRRYFGRRASMAVGLVLLTVVVLMCVFVPIFSRYDPGEFVAPAFQAPSLTHLFGTDAVGRDVFVRTFAGGRVDLVAAAVAAGFALVVGTTIGTFSGATRRRWLDSTLMRVVDAVVSFPLVILVLALVVMIGADRSFGPAPPGLTSALLALMAVQWAIQARIARGQALTLRDSDFVAAARISGLPQPAIIRRHIAPGVARITAAYAITDVVLVVVILSSLPFLGAGVQPPYPEWGSIMYEGRGFLQQAWWITILPGAVLALTGLALSLVADALLDTRRML
jgi:peptide/nickel transport system permease protein